MTVYDDSDQLYAVLQSLFDRVAEADPGVNDAIAASHLVIRLHCTGPEAEVWVNARKRPLEITYGQSRLRPALDIELAAGTLHRILLDEVSLKSALAKGLLKVKGPVWKVTVLADFFRQGQDLYAEVLCEQGLTLPE